MGGIKIGGNMKKSNDKEKSIKPKPIEFLIRTFAPSDVWPNVSEVVKKSYPWHNVLRDWLCQSGIDAWSNFWVLSKGDKND